MDNCLAVYVLHSLYVLHRCAHVHTHTHIHTFTSISVHVIQRCCTSKVWKSARKQKQDNHLILRLKSWGLFLFCLKSYVFSLGLLLLIVFVAALRTTIPFVGFFLSRKTLFLYGLDLFLVRLLHEVSTFLDILVNFFVSVSQKFSFCESFKR